MIKSLGINFDFWGNIFVNFLLLFFQIFGKRGKRREREREREIFEYAKADLDKTFFLSFFFKFSQILKGFFLHTRHRFFDLVF